MGNNKLWMTRDTVNDVLYLINSEGPCEIILEDYYGIVWRCDAERRLIGLTMSDFIARWPERQPVLRGLLTIYLGKKAPQIFRMISAEAARPASTARAMQSVRDMHAADGKRADVSDAAFRVACVEYVTENYSPTISGGHEKDSRGADIEVTDAMINAGRAAAVGIWGDKSLSSIYRAMRAIERRNGR